MRRKMTVVKEEMSNPLYIDEIKAYLAMNEDYRIDDEVLSGLVTSARQTCEDYTGISIAKRTMRYALTTSSHEIKRGTTSDNIIIDLPRPPLIAVEKVEVEFLTTGETIPLKKNVDYVTSGDQLFLIDFDVDSILFALSITYTTGYGDSCPESIKEVIKRLVQRSYVMKGTDLMGLTDDLALRLTPFKTGRV